MHHSITVMTTMDLDPGTAPYRVLPAKSNQHNTELLTADPWLSFTNKYCGYFAVALSRVSGPEDVTFGQQSFKPKLTWKAMQHVFQYYCSLSPAKLEAHDSDHNSLGAYENAIWGGAKNLTEFLPIHMSCYPVIGKTNKGTGWLDMIWLWQITLIATYHFALLHIIWTLVQWSFWEMKVRSTGILCPLFSTPFFFYNRHSFSFFLAQHHPDSQR